MNTLQCYPEFQMITSSRFYFLSNVWINWMLMLSSDITAWKLGSDFDWLIVQGKHLHNYVCWSSRTAWSPDLIKWINLHCRENGSANFAKSAINFPYKWTFPVILSLVLICFRALQPLSGHALDTGIDQQTSAMLQTVQKFAARIVSGTRKFDHVTPILKQLQWLPIIKQLAVRDATMVFKCWNGLAPPYLCQKFKTRSE